MCVCDWSLLGASRGGGGVGRGCRLGALIRGLRCHCFKQALDVAALDLQTKPFSEN